MGSAGFPEAALAAADSPTSTAISRIAGCRPARNRSVTAGRMGISAQAIDNTLYDAFGQRQVSVMYTQLNQYHVVMEVDAAVLAESGRIEVTVCGGRQRPAGSLERVFALCPQQHGAVSESPGPVSVRDDFLQSAGGDFAEPGGSGDRSRRNAKSGCPPPFTEASRAPHRPIRTRLRASRF